MIPVTSVMCTLLALCAACGGPSAPPPAPAAPAVIATPRRTALDLEVARVNGRPVWASCVTAQAGLLTSRTVDEQRAEALAQCVAFELLAQAAEARGAAAAPEVAEATRAAAVNRLVATEFEPRYQTADDLRQLVELAMKRNGWRMHLVQLRASTFARFVVAKDAPPEQDARARALAERLAAELAGEPGLYNVHLTDAARRIAAGSDIKLETADVKPTHQDGLVEPYAQALYAIPEIGRSSPAVRTPWGWDVLVWTGGVEPKETSREDLIAQMLPELRRRQFALWVTQLGKQLGVHIELDRAGLGQLDAEAAP